MSYFFFLFGIRSRDDSGSMRNRSESFQEITCPHSFDHSISLVGSNRVSTRSTPRNKQFHFQTTLARFSPLFQLVGKGEEETRKRRAESSIRALPRLLLRTDLLRIDEVRVAALHLREEQERRDRAGDAARKENCGEKRRVYQ